MHRKKLLPASVIKEVAKTKVMPLLSSMLSLSRRIKPLKSSPLYVDLIRIMARSMPRYEGFVSTLSWRPKLFITGRVRFHAR